MTGSFQVHDLLKLTPDGVVDFDGIARSSPSLLRSIPFVVVRRAEARGHLVPIGVRGKERQERYAGWLHRSHIAARIAPEEIGMPCPRSDLPAFQALRTIRKRLSGSPWTWGPSGSVAFELVSGAPVVHARSDLDLMVRAAEPLADSALRALLEVTRDAACSVDIQIETPGGAFSPGEYLRSQGQCLLRTVHGPVLVASPWLSRHPVESIAV